MLLYFDIIILAICGIFSFITLRNERWSIMIIVFTLSVFNPFGKYLAIPLGLSLPCLFIIIFTLAKTAKSFYNKQDLKIATSKKIHYVYYLFFIGILMGLYKTSLGNNYVDSAGFSNYTQIINISSYFIIIIFFYRILMEYILDFKFQDVLMKVFCLSVLIQIAIYLKFYNSSADSIFFHEMLDSDSDSDVGTMSIRYMSLIGDYELTVDYAIIVICFCMVGYYRARKSYLKLYNIGVLLISVFLAITTGTRSFIVVGVFIAGLLFLTDIKRYLYFISIPLLLIFIFGNTLLAKFPEQYSIFARFQESIEQYNHNENLNTITNRNFSSALNDLISNTNVFGNGSFSFYELDGNNMVSHNLFFAMYAKYGIPGVIILLMSLIFFIRMLYNVIKKPSTSLLKREAMLFLIFLIGLILEELKISALRNISVLLIYVFFFFNIYCIHIRNEFLKR